MISKTVQNLCTLLKRLELGEEIKDSESGYVLVWDHENDAPGFLMKKAGLQPDDQGEEIITQIGSSIVWLYLVSIATNLAMKGVVMGKRRRTSDEM